MLYVVYVWYRVLSRDCHALANSASPSIIRDEKFYEEKSDKKYKMEVIPTLIEQSITN